MNDFDSGRTIARCLLSLEFSKRTVLYDNIVFFILISDAGSVTISIEADISVVAPVASDMQFLQFQIRNFLL